MKILTRYPIISWLGLVVLIYVSGEMLLRGTIDSKVGVLPIMGVIEGVEFEHGGGHGGHDRDDDEHHKDDDKDDDEHEDDDD